MRIVCRNKRLLNLSILRVIYLLVKDYTSFENEMMSTGVTMNVKKWTHVILSRGRDMKQVISPRYLFWRLVLSEKIGMQMRKTKVNETFHSNFSENFYSR